MTATLAPPVPTLTPPRRVNLQSVFVLGFLHLGAATGLLHAFRSPPSAKVWVLFAAMWLVPQLGITVGYHRMETHNGFKCHPWVRGALLVSGAMAVQGEISGWVLNHRLHHHFQDQPGLDPHSPLEYPGVKGLLWAHIGWLLFHFERPVQYRSSVRMEADPLVRWQRRWYVALVAASFAIPFAVAGWSGLLVAGFVRVVLVLHVTWSVNSVCHIWGTPARDSLGNAYLGDDSRNNIVVEILALGEGYHSNHHAQPTWAFHGWRRFSFDPSKWVIQLLETLGLASAVRRPDPTLVFKPHQLRAQRPAA
ncbi:MAG TPA: fatty acid desaturase [Acidimicrobiales bacterium]|nr:fatty acid desaturase [Acidimicrobiales bacterium]